MARLMYFDENHEYVVDGEKLSSVSHILRFLGREFYFEINQDTVDRAAERGRSVHQACEALDMYGHIECDDEYVPYIRAYINFVKDHSVQWAEVEKRLYHIERRYAGTLDRFGLVDGVPSLLDIKTTATVHKTLVKAQLNAYDDMRRSNGLPDAGRLLCLQLMNSGKYRIYDAAKDMTEFDSCYCLHSALSKKHGRGLIE